MCQLKYKNNSCLPNCNFVYMVQYGYCFNISNGIGSCLSEGFSHGQAQYGFSEIKK